MSLQTATSERYDKAMNLLEFMKDQESIHRISVSEAFGRLNAYCDSTGDPLVSGSAGSNPYLVKAKKKKCIIF